MACSFQNIEAIFRIFATLFGVCVYLFDICTDIYSAYQHYTNADYIWYRLTVASITLPMILTSFVTICLPPKKLPKKFLIPTLLICSPIVPLGLLIWNLVDTIRRYPNNKFTEDSAVNYALVIKLFMVAMEALPQGTLQTYVVMVHLNSGIAPELWQLLTIIASFLALAYSITTNQHLSYDKLIPIGKPGMFMFVLLYASSRILVSCIYATVLKSLIIVPLAVEFGSYIILSCSALCGDACCDNWISRNVSVPILMCSFTSNLGFAIGGLYLPSPLAVFQPIALTTLIISTICWSVTIPYIHLVYQNVI